MSFAIHTSPAVFYFEKLYKANKAKCFQAKNSPQHVILHYIRQLLMSHTVFMLVTGWEDRTRKRLLDNFPQSQSIST